MAKVALDLVHVAAEALRLLIPLLERPVYERILADNFAEGFLRGDTVSVREAPKMESTRDPHIWTFFNEKITPVVLDHLEWRTVQVSPGDFLLAIDQFSRRILEPQVMALAEAIHARWVPGSTLVCAMPQIPPRGMASGGCQRVTDPHSKLSILVVRDYDLMSNQDILCIGMLFGIMGNGYEVNWFEQQEIHVLTYARLKLAARLVQVQKAA